MKLFSILAGYVLKYQEKWTDLKNQIFSVLKKNIPFLVLCIYITLLELPYWAAFQIT